MSGHRTRVLGCALALCVLASAAAACGARPVERAPAQAPETTEATGDLMTRMDCYLRGANTYPWPATYEVKTIRIQWTEGLFYVAPYCDMQRELELMNATVVDNGPLYDAIAGNR